MYNKRIIRLVYRKIVDADSSSPWERLVFDASYKEFLMQSQLYNPEKKYSSFGDLLAHVPGAYKLHFLVSASVVGYLRQLNGKVPDIKESTGQIFLPFVNYRFEIVNSDIHQRDRHQVAFNFVSEPLLWLDTIGDRLLISVGGKTETGTAGEEEILTGMVQLQPFLSIYSVKEMR